MVLRERVFIDDDLEKEFDQKGYLVLDFLDTSEIEILSKKVEELKPADNFSGQQDTLINLQSFHCTFFDRNQEYKNQVFDLLNEVYKGVLENVLNHYKTIQANIFLKPPRTGEVSPHQNLTIVDERQYTSVSLWCPLVDVDESNGALLIVPGSHRKFAKYRNTTILWPMLDFFRSEEGIKYFESINMKAGQLLILDDSIIHASPVNTTDHKRPVLHVMAGPQAAHPIFCELERNEIRIHEVKERFWQNHIPGNFPDFNESNIIAILPYDDVSLSEEEFLKELER